MITLLKTAEKWGKPPSHWLGGEEWGDKDLKLTLAYTLYKDGLCACGHPAVIAHDDEHDGWIVAKDDVVCHVCAALERKQEGERAKGQKIYAVDERGVTPVQTSSESPQSPE